MSRREKLRRRAGGLLVDSAFRGLAHVGRLHPKARPHRHNVEVVRNVPYQSGRSGNRLDIYRPSDVNGPLPVLLYIHGGGFRILSKDTHWLMGLAFAREGYLVFNIDYRLAPRHPFPAAVEDSCEAFVWVQENAERWGGDPSRLVLAGESAGANLVTGVTVASCFARSEPWAREVFETGTVPDAVIAACGMLQVSDVERYTRRPKFGRFISDRLEEVTHLYLPPSEDFGETMDLADPLCLLERKDAVAERSLPPFFAPVGTKDPLLDDTRRLASALEARDVPCEARYYPGEVHAFHAFVWRKQARECWRDTFQFLAQHVSESD